MSTRQLNPNELGRRNRAARRIERCQRRYDRTRSHAALLALRNAVTAALMVDIELGLAGAA